MPQKQPPASVAVSVVFMGSVFILVGLTSASTVSGRRTTGGEVAIGKGTTSPAEKLAVAGDVQVGNSAATCDATTKGTIRYNNTIIVLEICNCTSNLIFTGTTSAVTGMSNSSNLYGPSDAASPHAAAAYCESLNINGKTDWYLPAFSELNIVYSNRAVIRNFDSGGIFYWTSSDAGPGLAGAQRFSDGYQYPDNKPFGYLVRWVRR